MSLVLLTLVLPARTWALDLIVKSTTNTLNQEALEFGDVIDFIPALDAYLLSVYPERELELDDLEDLDGIASVEENRSYVSLECQQSFIWLLDYAPPALPASVASPTSDSPRVAFIDSAWDSHHVAFHGQKLPGRDLLDPAGDASLSERVLASPSELSRAGNHHGTAVAGALASVSRDFWIAPYRIMDEECRGTTFDLARAVINAVDDGHSVILMAVGSDKKMRLLNDAIEHADANDVLLVTSAGNDGSSAKPKAAFYPSLMIVAAVDQYGQPAPFTNRHKTIDISDYGVELELAYPADGLALASGTSFAAARTAAAAAAIRAAHPSLSAEDVRDILCESALPLDHVANSVRKKLGCGITDLNAALALAMAPRDPVRPSSR